MCRWSMDSGSAGSWTRRPIPWMKRPGSSPIGCWDSSASNAPAKPKLRPGPRPNANPRVHEELMFKNDLLKGHRILITGGGTGIGKSIAQHFLGLGAEIVICGRRENVLAETAAELMQATGGKVAYKTCDIREAAQVDALCEWAWSEKP